MYDHCLSFYFLFVFEGMKLVYVILFDTVGSNYFKSVQKGQMH